MKVPFNHFEHLFEPIHVGRHELRNRVEFAPMVCDLTISTGEASQNYVDFVESQARSGVALITLGATPINHTTAPDYPAELDVTDDNKATHLFLLSEAAHRGGALLSAELVHAGLGADPALISSPHAIAPSVFPLPGKSRFIKEMDRHDMDQVIADYVDCAVRLKKANFDAVMIHGAHGNLLGQFVSPMTNHRTDHYGGSFENRIRFPFEVLDAVREAVGPDFLIEYRISGDEIHPEGSRVEDAIEFLKRAQKYIDLVSVSAGIVVDPRSSFYTMPPYFRPKAHNVPYSRAIKACPDIHIPVSVVGSIVTADLAEEILASGGSDMVAMARPLLADQDMLNKAWHGRQDEARPCLRCWACAGSFGGHLSCAVNPRLARTAEYRTPGKAEQRKNVVVIGGGIAGCQAAMTLTERGHHVVLFEKSDRLGGLLNDINKLSFKDDMLRYTHWLQASTMKCGADIRLNTFATPEMVMLENPDAIVVATGSVPAAPPIPGLRSSKVHNVLDVDAGRVSLSGKIVVCGGGLSGCESGLQLAMDGCDVTIVDMLPMEEFARGVHDITRENLMCLLSDHKVRLIGSSVVRGISENGVTIEGKDWKYTTLEADYVVDAFGMVKNPCFEQFRYLIPDVYLVGDARQVRNIKNANLTAYDTCCRI